MSGKPSIASVIGNCFYLVGVGAFLILSFQSWYVSEYQDENAWAGELSLAAALAIVVGAGFVLASFFLSGYGARLWMSVLALCSGVTSLACVLVYISDNVDDIVVRGEILPSGMEPTAYFALIPCGIAVVASILSVVGAARARVA